MTLEKMKQLKQLQAEAQESYVEDLLQKVKTTQKKTNKQNM